MTPHHLTLDEEDGVRLSTQAKCAPALRGRSSSRCAGPALQGRRLGDGLLLIGVGLPSIYWTGSAR